MHTRVSFFVFWMGGPSWDTLSNFLPPACGVRDNMQKMTRGGVKSKVA